MIKHTHRLSRGTIKNIQNIKKDKKANCANGILWKTIQPPECCKKANKGLKGIIIRRLHFRGNLTRIEPHCAGQQCESQQSKSEDRKNSPTEGVSVIVPTTPIMCRKIYIVRHNIHI
jgi:hypothetical protein